MEDNFMKIKIYLFRFATGLTAFVFGIGFFIGGQYFISAFQTKEQKTESVALVKNEPVKIEQLIYPPRSVETTTRAAELWSKISYPPRNVQIAKTSVSEQETK